LAQSFDDDPYINWIVGTHGRRAARIERLFAITLESLSNDLRDTYTIEGSKGCVVWKHSRDCKLPLWRELALLPAFCRVGGVLRIGELLRAFGHIDALHAKHAPEPHYFLHVIGVSPGHQGRGLGHRLLQPSLDRCDREGMAAYLETFKAKNLAFYERHGFRRVGSVELSPLPRGWLMRREPESRVS